MQVLVPVVYRMLTAASTASASLKTRKTTIPVPTTQLADSSIARKNLGNAHLLTFGLTIGYRIHAF